MLNFLQLCAILSSMRGQGKPLRQPLPDLYPFFLPARPPKLAALRLFVINTPAEYHPVFLIFTHQFKKNLFPTPEPKAAENSGLRLFYCGFFVVSPLRISVVPLLYKYLSPLCCCAITNFLISADRYFFAKKSALGQAEGSNSF